jgi:hypothetical protein
MPLHLADIKVTFHSLQLYPQKEPVDLIGAFKIRLIRESRYPFHSLSAGIPSAVNLHGLTITKSGSPIRKLVQPQPIMAVPQCLPLSHPSPCTVDRS